MKTTDRMSVLPKVFCTAAVVVALFSGCDAKNSAPLQNRANVNEVAGAPIRSRADLERLLILGMGTNEIVAALGEPSRISTASKGEQEWRHSLPPFLEDSEAEGMFSSYVIGVTIWITNGQLAFWGCNSTSVPRYSVERSEIAPGNGAVQTDAVDLKFFVVSKDSNADGRFIDTERLPRLGFIQPNPILAISKVKEVTLEERTWLDSKKHTNTVWSFGVLLTQEDGVRLKVMTTTNINQRLLIVMGDEPVSAPTLMMPLETGSFEIVVPDKSAMELLQKGFARMERQNQ